MAQTKILIFVTSLIIEEHIVLSFKTVYFLFLLATTITNNKKGISYTLRENLAAMKRCEC